MKIVQFVPKDFEWFFEIMQDLGFSREEVYEKYLDHVKLYSDEVLQHKLDVAVDESIRLLAAL